jgi:hypothetical protein
MKKEESRGLLAVFTDVDKDYWDEFQKWHNCEHIAERVSIPGFLTGHRYRGIGKASEFMFLYETSDAKVLGSEPYLKRLNNPTPWTQASLVHLKNSTRTAHTLLAWVGKKLSLTAPFILACKFGCQPADEQEMIRWYKEEYLPKAGALPGVNQARFYQSSTEISNIPTEERKMHGSYAAKEQFLALYAVSSLNFVNSKAWQEFSATAQNKKLAKKIESLKEEMYWLHFTLDAPKTK